MESILAVAGVISVAMTTPGPNNFIVMSVASSRGFAAAVPAIAGVISGCTLLLVLIWAGAAAIFDVFPVLRLILLLAGAAYLIWLGAMVIRNAAGRSVETNAFLGNGLPTTFAGVAAFQFFNPKAWVLVLTAIATITGQFSDAATLAILVPLYVSIPIICLSLWALGGVALTLWLDGGKTRRMFDFTMGALLILCAVFLIMNRS